MVPATLPGIEVPEPALTQSAVVALSQRPPPPVPIVVPLESRNTLAARAAGIAAMREAAAMRQAREMSFR